MNTSHMRDLGKRLLHEGDFSYENTSLDTKSTQWTYQHPGENTPTHGCGMRISKTHARKTQADQPGTTRRLHLQVQVLIPHNKRNRKIMTTTVPTVAQDEVLTPCPMTFDSDTRNDEVAVDVPLPEETVEMSGENSQGWITEEAFFTGLAWCTTSTAAQK